MNIDRGKWKETFDKDIIRYCLDALEQSEANIEKVFEQQIVKGLSVEEVVGALVYAEIMLAEIIEE